MSFISSPASQSKVRRAGFVPSLKTCLVFATIGSLIFVTYLGNLAAAGFIAGALALATLSRANPLHAFIASPLPWLFTLWILFSAMWSSDPGFTFYEGLQYFFTCLAGAILAQTVDPRRLVRAISLCSAAALAISATSGIYGVDEHGIVSLVGVFGSKNFMAYYATVGLLAAVATALDRGQPKVMRLASLGTAALAVYIIFAARSLGTVVAGLLAAFALTGLILVLRLSVLSRSLIIAFGLAAALTLAVLGVMYTDQVLEMLGKDTNLTGRAFLWARGWQYIEMRPVLGTGYYDFWKQGSVEAEGLWRQLHIGSRSGFHFHNMFINAGVELGYTGMILVGIMVAAGWRGALKWLAMEPSPASCFFVGFLLYSLPRLFIEVDVPSIYGWGPVLIFYVATYAGLIGRADRPIEVGQYTR